MSTGIGEFEQLVAFTVISLDKAATLPMVGGFRWAITPPPNKAEMLKALTHRRCYLSMQVGSLTQSLWESITMRDADTLRSRGVRTFVPCLLLGVTSYAQPHLPHDHDHDHKNGMATAS